jgi:hypothetical protein
LTLDTDEKCFRIDITAQQLKDDPGFDKDHGPSMADATWALGCTRIQPRALLGGDARRRPGARERRRYLTGVRR